MLEQEINQNDLSAVRSSAKGEKDLNDTNSALDSGFLSGPQGMYSSEIDSAIGDVSAPLKEKRQPAQIDTDIDSGLIADRKLADTQSSKLGDVNETNLTDWFKDLSFGESGPKAEPKKFDTKNLWKLCYKEDKDGDTQLHIAIINEVTRFITPIIHLAPAPWLLDIKNDDALAPIHLAVLTGQPNVVRQLLIAGASASLRNGDGNTALHLACLNGDLRSVKAILAPITVAELEYHSKFMNQTRQSLPHRQISIDLEQKNFDGQNCVHIASQRSYIEIFRHLIWAGADINSREGLAGYTPLHIATENGNEELIKCIFSYEKRLNTEALTYGQLTAYQLADVCEYENIMKLLEDNGCEVLSSPEYDYDSDDACEFDSDN